MLGAVLALMLGLTASGCKASKLRKEVVAPPGGEAKPERAQEAAPTEGASSAALPAQSWEDTCRRLATVDFPTSDRPSAAQKDGLKPGDSKRYYYGIGVEKDYVKARYAAFLELDRNYGGWFAGNSILMMLYANGFGVARNANLATKLACGEEGAPAEMAGRVQHLQNLPTRAKLPAFDFCDDATSGMTMGACEMLAVERELPEIDRRIGAITADWPEAQRAALTHLRARAEAYWELHASGEVDLSGTDRDGVRAREKVEQRKAFANTLEEFARGPSVVGALDAQQADAALNEAYKAALTRDLSYTTINADGVRATERAWLKYRDAWAALGKLRYPSVEAQAWKAWLALERTRELSGIGS